MPRYNHRREAENFQRKKTDFVGNENDNNNNEDDDHNTWDVMANQIEESVSFLGERRDKGNITREVLLERIIKCLKHSYIPDLIQTQKNELLRITPLALNSQNTEEQILSCKLLSLLSVVNATSWKSYYQEFANILKNSVLISSDFEVRAAGIEALCLICFVWAEEESERLDCLSYLETILANDEDLALDKETSHYFQSCLDMWCLLITRLDDNTIVDEILPRTLEYILNFLQCDDVVIRLAAGEALGFLASTVAFTEDAKSWEYTPYFFNGYFNVDEVITMLECSDIHSQRKINKKDREKQRHGFKDVLASLKTGEAPNVSLTVNEQQFKFSDWKSVIRIACFRHLLETGFLIHMRYNPLLSQELDIHVNREQIVSKSEKKFQMAINTAEAKDRSLRIKASRTSKLLGRSED